RLRGHHARLRDLARVVDAAVLQLHHHPGVPRVAMRSESVTGPLGALALAGLCVLLVPAALPAGTTAFEEKTRVEGRVPIDLDGVWFLVAQTHLAEGKYRTFLELLRISPANHAGPSLHLLDVSLPKDIDGAVKAANKQFT